MSRRVMTSLCLAVALSVPAAAETLEAAAFGGSAAFAELQMFRAPQMPQRAPGFKRAVFTQDQEEKPLVTPVAFDAPSGGAVSRVVKEVDTVPMLNRHFKTSLQYTLGGKTVWVSGAFDRKQSAFVSILVDGATPKFFNVKDLLTNPQVLDIGTGKYKLSLSPDLVNQMDSEIVLTNAANRKDQQRITLTEMLDAVAAAGEKIDVTGQSYQLFYYDDVAGGTKSFCLILKDKKNELHIFLVPAELIPKAGKPAVFKMFDNKAIGLMMSGDKLQISE